MQALTRFLLPAMSGLCLASVVSADFQNLVLPAFADSANAQFAYWGGDPGMPFTGFSSGFGAPNLPNDPASTVHATLTQLTPGGTLTSTGNIYNPAGASLFRIDANLTVAAREVVFQFRTLGTVADIPSFQLELSDGASSILLAPTTTELLLDTVMGFPVQEWMITWDVVGAALQGTDLTIEFQAVGPNMSFDDARLDVRNDTNLATAFCAAVPNSTGQPGVMGTFGSDVLAENGTELRAWSLPPNQFGYFLVGQTQGFVPLPGGSQGNLCLTGSVGRYVAAVQSSGQDGQFSLSINLTALPTPGTPVSAAAGETWLFQGWYRDLNPAATSNFTGGAELVLR